MITTSGDAPSRTTTAAPPLQKETTAGNYFVSNYPPFSYWKADQVPDFQAALDRPPVPGTPLGIYVHIPFCRKRCHFCYFKVYTDKDSAEIRGTSTRCSRKWPCTRREAVHRWSPAGFVYFGGGTPSYLSESQLKYLPKA
jgi:oxygen-independent coproporphyrinogen-3 oxidase